MNTVIVAARLLELGLAVERGALSASEAALQLADIGLDMVPVDDLRGSLTDAARARADLIADAAEAAKFGS
ncbi:hypothetical protein AKJ09_03656 [Labilithrix luteola]|uniref:Uncharacterized protein n=1 Tax=Labilithrix luteola TaxID=1391654 RepID=A0A0K1PTZ6_9BACT|nr:hypothetical protein [Labilithrix luteola]AKU96992.1 hypothetical protein AKJ09_03656 [Labilithrix luteola]